MLCDFKSQGIFEFTTMSTKNAQMFDNHVLAKLSRYSTSSDLFNQSLQRVLPNNLSYFSSLLHNHRDHLAFLTNGPFCFLATLIQLQNQYILKSIRPFNSSSFPERIATFLDNPYVTSYLKNLVASTDETSTTRSASKSYILFKYECEFVYSYLKLTMAISDIQVRLANFRYLFSVKV